MSARSLRRTIAALAMATLLGMSPAFAHAFLAHATPAVGATVSAPHVLRLTFSEAVEPLFSHVTVQDAKGQPVHTASMQAEDGGRELVLGLPGLPPGSYTVRWHVTSVDTHKTEGSFRFTVAP